MSESVSPVTKMSMLQGTVSCMVQNCHSQMSTAFYKIQRNAGKSSPQISTIYLNNINAYSDIIATVTRL